ncbi:beta-ketoacyl-ACP synthase III [Miltoncostaea marina]|uniref:beta-ketoacyl-ACP synthase III n=1 Tax=Miltoncostaea marina TaxID=2843215 RepID=UPI001C3D2C16|nr:beta-ketoacyl-ACP synthase III [Miltoncostaea marina]
MTPDRSAPRRRARLAALGGYAPARVVTNAEIERRVDTTDEWIRTRTGIRERRYAAPDETTADMAAVAAERVLASAGLPSAEVDMVIVPTATPDALFPATAAIVADRIGARRAAAYDLSAACSGFVYALAQATALVEAGMAGNVLVVGSEVLSRVTDHDDRATCILFADGAGGALVTAGDAETTTGFLAFDLGADGSGADQLVLPVGGDRRLAAAGGAPADACIRMDGPAVFRFATRVMVESAQRLLDGLSMGIADIDLVVAHQANSRIMDHAAERLGIPPERLFNNLELFGNTSSASIPMALAQARDAGRLSPGDMLLLVGFGGGLTWASSVVRYEPLGEEHQWA